MRKGRGLDERDILLLEGLLRYKYLDRVQIMRLLELPHKTQYSRLATKLKSYEYIETIEMPVWRNRMRTGKRPEHTEYGNVHYITTRGAQLMEREGGILLDELGYKKVKPFSSAAHYPHRHKLTNFRISLDKELEAHKIPLGADKWLYCDTDHEKVGGKSRSKTKISTEDNEGHIIPDIAFCMQTPKLKKEALFFVEVDTAKETIRGRVNSPANTIMKKYKVYNEVWRSRVFVQRFDTTATAFRVLTVTEDLQHIRSIQEKTHTAADYNEMFLLTTHELINTKGVLFSDIWYTLDPKDKKPKALFDVKKWTE